jgi:hypothetical protein
MSNAVLDFLRSALPGKALIINPEKEVDSDGIKIVLARERDCEECSIAKYPIMLAPKLIDIKENRFLIASKSIPRIRKMKPGEKIPRNYIPIADWDGNKVNLAIPMSTNSTVIRDILMTGLPLLLEVRGTGSSYTEMCEYIKFGFDSERVRLEKNIRSNKESYNRIIKEMILQGLEVLEKTAVEKHAREHWEMMSEMIPSSLQELYIKDKHIIGITQPVSMMGVYLGSYKISIPIIHTTDNDVLTIVHVDKTMDRDQNCHPHIRSTGHICWGNLSDKVRELKTKKDYHGLMECALRIIRNYNSDDPYTHLRAWGTVVADPSEAGSRICRENGPGASLNQAKKCMKCTNKGCTFKKNDSVEIFSACVSLSLPQDCIICKEEGKIDCPYKNDAYIRCFGTMKSLGTAFCMLRCTNTNCTYLEEAQKICATKNRRANGSCQASEKCRMSCSTKGD